MSSMPPHATAPVVLDVDGLTVEFVGRRGAWPVLEDIRFQIRRGELFALVGESGCGKTLTALAVMRLLPPAARIVRGSVRLEGRELTALPESEMRQVRGGKLGMIFQEPMTALNPVRTIGAQVLEAVEIHQSLRGDAARRRVLELLDLVGLPDPKARAQQYPHELSGGMRQRVLIAMTLAGEPDVLIADEPTTALDVTVQAQMFELLHRLADQRRMAIWLITHDLALVYHHADTVAVLYAGRVVEAASRSRFYAAAAHPYSRLLLRAIPAQVRPRQRLPAIEGAPPAPWNVPAGCRFADRCPLATATCRSEMPPWASLAPDHWVACWRAGELDRMSAGTTHDRVHVPHACPRLVVSNLRVHFAVRTSFPWRRRKMVRAVDGVDLELMPAETLALVGESGCGKSTVARALLGLVPVTTGSIQLDGRELVGRSRRELAFGRRRMQIVFQDPFSSLDPRQTVGDAIVEALETHRIGRDTAERRARAERLLERVGLRRELLGRYPHELSGGQRQRVAIARALAVEPELIVCDEATSSLDVSVQAQILNLLRDLQDELGLSYLFITHDLGVVRYLAHRVAVMYLGELVETGTTEQVLNAPQHPYTKALISAVPRLDSHQHSRFVLPGEVPSPIAPPPGCRFHTRCPWASDRCRDEAPQWTEVGPGQRVRCWRWREIREEPVEQVASSRL